MDHMIAILAEKPSVGQDIARVVGADSKQDGYLEGNGYLVTWALGHLISLAPPSSYGYSKTKAERLPLLPNPFQYIIRQSKPTRGLITDPAAARQMNVIDHVFSRCQSIVVATDAGREGELIFRYIYDYLGYTKPFRRLWISSLTDESIREGLAHLRDGHDYDGLAAAAACRAKADWLVGINASRALAAASGLGNNALGRLQTPTLAMICRRYREHRSFSPTPYWQLFVILRKGTVTSRFCYLEDIGDQPTARRLFDRLGAQATVTVTRTERRTVQQEPPLLYGLAALQKACNAELGISAERTQEIAQALYEKKLVTYPRTGCRYIPDEVLRSVPQLLRQLLALPEFATVELDCTQLTTRSVDAGKVTDHHAIITTGVRPADWSQLERKIYLMIAGRMLEAFMQPCCKEELLQEVAAGGMTFRRRAQRIIHPGWRAVYRREEDRDPAEEDSPVMELFAGEVVPVAGRNLTKLHTTPKPLFTEGTLLTAMEQAGREVPDEQAAIGGLGIGTPATHAAILSSLFEKEYIERSGKWIVPTERGLYIDGSVRGMRIADVACTAGWERALQRIEQAHMQPESFLEAIAVFTRQVTEEVAAIRFPSAQPEASLCPKCGQGRMILQPTQAKCSNEACGLVVFRSVLNKQLSDRQLRELFTRGRTKVIKGFLGRRDNPFDGALAFDEDFKLGFVHPEEKLP